MDLFPTATDFDDFDGFTEAELELDMFGPGLHGYSRGDPEALPPRLPTRVTAEFCNQLVGELMAVIERSGQQRSKVNLDQLWTAIEPIGAGVYGNGAGQPANVDEMVVNGEAMLTGDWYGRRARILPNGHLRTNGWRLYVSELLTIEPGGVISNDGQPGASAADGGMGGLGGRGGIDRTLMGGGAGGQGEVNDGIPGTSALFAPAGQGGSGGSVGNLIGGLGGTSSPPPETAGLPFGVSTTTTGKLEGNGMSVWLRGGSGGGGGAGTGNLLVGGGGGGGGGIVLLAAYRLDCRGEIRAAGGAGGAALGFSAGGGGGQGGRVLLTYRYRLDEQGLVHAPGGAGGVAVAGKEGLPGEAGEVVIVRA